MSEGGSDRKIHIRLSEQTHRQLRIRCAELDVTIQDYVSRVIEDSLEGTTKKGRARQTTRKKP